MLSRTPRKAPAKASPAPVVSTTSTRGAATWAGAPPGGTSSAPRSPRVKITVAFAGTDAFTNPFGEVLGGFLAAMLYDTVGPALLATLEPDQFQSTLEMSVRFLRPVRPGRIVGRGRVVHRDGDLAVLEAELLDPKQETIATATATARVIPLAEAAGAP